MLFGFLLDIFFPKTCVGCGEWGTYLCTKCKQEIVFFPHPLCPACGMTIEPIGIHTICKNKTYLDGLLAVGAYTGLLKKLITKFKYRGMFDLANTLTNLAPRSLPQVDMVSFVPMHARKERERGFNQARVLAKSYAKSRSLEMVVTLRKTAYTTPQARLDRKERLKNVKKVFEVVDSSCKNQTVLLVDDVTTTRTTLNECARVLKKAGAKNVYALVLAHGK